MLLLSLESICNSACVCVCASVCVSVSVYSRRFAFHASINKMNWKSKKNRNRKRGRRKRGRERESSSGRACRQDNRLVELADSLVVLHPVFQWKSKHFVKRKHTHRQREGQLYTHTHAHTQKGRQAESQGLFTDARVYLRKRRYVVRAQDAHRTWPGHELENCQLLAPIQSVYLLVPPQCSSSSVCVRIWQPTYV